MKGNTYMIIKKIRTYCMDNKCPYLSFCDNQKQKAFCMKPVCDKNNRKYIERGTVVKKNNRNEKILLKLYEPNLRDLGVPLL